MAQPNSVSEKAGVTFQPPCPNCGQPMWLVRIAALDSTHDIRMFECKVCDHSESKVVEFRRTG